MSPVQERIRMTIWSFLITEGRTYSPLLIELWLEKVLSLANNLVEIIDVMILREIRRCADGLLVHFQKLLLNIDTFCLKFYFSHFKFILSYLQMVRSSQQMLKIHVCLWIHHARSIHLNFSRIIKDWIYLSCHWLMFLSCYRRRLLINFLPFRTRWCLLLMNGTCHELVDLLICFFNFWSQHVFNLLLTTSKSRGEWLGWYFCLRYWSARWRSLKLFGLTLSNSWLRGLW